MRLYEPKPTKNQASERGSAITWIFIMVALVAALYYTFSQGSRTGSESLDRERTNLYASEILDYAQSIKQAVQTLQINDCTDTDMNFDNAIVSGFNNPSAPSDNSCTIFHPNGGGFNWLASTGNVGGFFEVTGNVRIPEIGDDATADLLFRWWDIDRGVCVELNEKVGLTGTAASPPVTNAATCPTSGGSCHFVGVYNQTHSIDNAGSEFDGRMAGCYDENGAGTRYVFYQTLIPR